MGIGTGDREVYGWKGKGCFARRMDFIELTMDIVQGIVLWVWPKTLF
jgi:hypothetical protein